MTRRNTNLTTADGLRVYDLDVEASELWAVAGPDGYDVESIDTDSLPDGFRWVTNEEWDSLQAAAEPHEITSLDAYQQRMPLDYAQSLLSGMSRDEVVIDGPIANKLRSHARDRCGATITDEGMESILDGMCEAEADIEEIEFRGEGYTVTLTDGQFILDDHVNPDKTYDTLDELVADHPVCEPAVAFFHDDEA